jgi:hypothetical protein
MPGITYSVFSIDAILRPEVLVAKAMRILPLASIYFAIVLKSTVM